MFTGLVNHCGKIIAIKNTHAGKIFTIACNFDDLLEGESICVDGACLTVTNHQSGQFNCDLSPETLALTRACQLKLGDKVNLERSMRLYDRLGGHFVTGHIDQVCQLQAKQPQGEFVEMRFTGVNAEGRKLLIKKGSIAINGVSLTINEVRIDGFMVMLIPKTLELTNLNLLAIGDNVNIEYDYLAKMVVNYLELNREAIHV